MKKTRIILAATGGVLALAVLVMAVLTWLAYSERAEALGGEEGGGLAEAVSSVERLLAKKPFPSEENRKLLERNRQVVEEWCEGVRREISRGDWCAPKNCTPAQFKEYIATDVKTLQGGESPIVKPDFAFGPFKDYLADKMPAAAQLPRLQRQWYDLMALFDVLSTNGVTQVVDVQVVERGAAEDAKDKAKAKAKERAKSKAKGDGAKGVREPSVETYRLTFVSKPSAFASVLRELSFQDRFTVVEGFAFVRERDAVAEALGGGEKKEKAVVTGRRGRRRGAKEEVAQVEQQQEGGSRQTVVFDPSTDSSVKVDLTVSVYDFHSLEGLTKDVKEEEGDSK